MIAIRIVCAWDSVEKAHAIERLLVAEGHAVSVACGLASLEDLEKRGDARECVVCVWSVDGVESYFVWRWVEATETSALVEIRLGDAAPGLEARREDPIDFTRWRGDRGDERWKELERRIKRVATGEARPRVEPVRAAMAFGAVLVAGISASFGTLLFDSGAPQRVAQAPQAERSEALAAPRSNVGGLEAHDALAEPEDADALEPFQRRRVSFVRQLAPSPGDTSFVRVTVLEPMQFRRSLLDQIRSPFDQILRDDGAPTG